MTDIFLNKCSKIQSSSPLPLTCCVYTQIMTGASGRRNIPTSESVACPFYFLSFSRTTAARAGPKQNWRESGSCHNPLNSSTSLECSLASEWIPHNARPSPRNAGKKKKEEEDILSSCFITVKFRKETRDGRAMSLKLRAKTTSPTFFLCVDKEGLFF